MQLHSHSDLRLEIKKVHDHLVQHEAVFFNIITGKVFGKKGLGPSGIF